MFSPFPTLLKKLVNKLYKIHEKKAALRAELSAHKAELKSGWYAFDGSVAFRLGSKNLGNLIQMKRYPIDPARNRITRGAIRLLYLSCPPFLSKLPASEKGQGEQLLITATGNVKIFNYDSKNVLTILPSEERAANLVQASAKLSASKIFTNVHAGPHSFSVVEPLYDGISLSQLTQHQQLKTTSDIVEKYASFFHQQKASYRDVDYFLGLFKRALELGLPGEIVNLLKEKMIVLSMKMSKCPFFPSHGDLHSGNVLVEKKSIIIIDLDTVCEMPFFYDLCSLFSSLSRSPENLKREGPYADYFSNAAARLLNSTAGTNPNLTRLEMLLVHFILYITENRSGGSKVLLQRDRILDMAQPVLNLIAEKGFR